MSQRHGFAGALMVAVGLLAGLASAQESPRTSWGAPDLQGIWDFRTITPLQRPATAGDQAVLTEEEAAAIEQATIQRNIELASREARRTETTRSVDVGEDGAPGFYNNFWLDSGTRSTGRTSLISDPPNGRIPPLTPEAAAEVEARRAHLATNPADSYTERNTSDRCLVGFNAGPPITPLGYNQNMQLFQTEEYVVLLTEMVHTARVVPLDGRGVIDGDIRLWDGDSRGYWEGGTLVVETANFRDDRKWVPLGSAPPGTGSSGNMTLVERFTRVDQETLLYEFTVTDPEVWVTPWSAQLPMKQNDLTLFEYACHEGNYSMDGILGGARADERAAGER